MSWKIKSLISILLIANKLFNEINIFKLPILAILFLSLIIFEFFETKWGFGNKPYLILSSNFISILYFFKIWFFILSLIIFLSYVVGIKK